MSKQLQKHASLWISLLAVLAIGAWPMLTGKALDRETAFTILKVVALASSLNILLGYTGYVSFGHVVFYGLGGYVGFYLISARGWNLWEAILAGGVAAAVLAYLLGEAILRLRGAYFALATIGVNEAVRAFINNFQPFGGPIGMEMNFKVYKLYGGLAHVAQMSFYILIGLTLVTIILSYWVRTSKFGLGLLAIREDEDAAEVMGVVAPQAKTWAYVLSAVMPGMIGALVFFKGASIEPAQAFHLDTSIVMIVMIMLGGQGTVFGPILGAAGYEALRDYLLVSPLFKDLQLAISGALLLIIVLFIPRGLVGWLRQRYPKVRRLLI